ncbi:hypothetical protein D3C86_1609670 [compost metagenome]
MAPIPTKHKVLKMNIFCTSSCPIQSAQDLSNNLVVKMILESAQMLSTAHYILDGSQVGYKPTHVNHPCSIFSRSGDENYQWLWQHFNALCGEYTHRTGKVHKTGSLLETLKTPPKNITKRPLSIDFLCMPDDCKKTLDVPRITATI